MNIYFYIETIPAQNPEVLAEIRKGITAPGQYKKPESIDEWMKANADAEAEKEWLRTSFDGALGQICCIGLAIDDAEPVSFYEGGESEIIRLAIGFMADNVHDFIPHSSRMSDKDVCFIGHNIVGFDLPFLKKRCIVNRIRPPSFIPFSAKPWDGSIFDTMIQWDSSKDKRISLNNLAHALGEGSKGGVSGADVWPMYKAGQFQEIADYCMNDVELTRNIHKRMTFQ